jgi:hypothetical protein
MSGWGASAYTADFEGYAAGLDGFPATTNPHLRDERLSEIWKKGWEEGNRRLQEHELTRDRRA